ncbi:MAG: patatin-like phospholipase family protein [Nitrospira sp.]
MASAFGKRALALGGGGFTGYLFEIGALTALDDLFEDGVTMNDLDVYVGVSAGAAAVSLIANGVKPRDILETNLSGTRPYYFDHRNVFSPAIGEGLKTFWRVTRQLVPLLKYYVRHYSGDEADRPPRQGPGRAPERDLYARTVRPLPRRPLQGQRFEQLLCGTVEGTLYPGH